METKEETEIIQVKDKYGEWVYIHAPAFLQAMGENAVTVFGMTLDTLAALRAEYIRRGGVEPMTPNSIRETFKKEA